MQHTCPRCSRPNPGDAQFCYHDGQVLTARGARPAVDPARQRFPMPFVFPSGQACHSFDELVLAVQGNWAPARDLLRHGVFAGFLGGLGRADLVVAARESAQFPDPDRGLAQLLGRLPSNVLEPARLGVEPGQVNLGSVRPGQDLRFDLHLHNNGMGLLAGSISCEACPWLVLGDLAAGSKRKLFQFLHDTTVPVIVRGKALTASSKPLTAKLLIESSGGQVEVPVKIEVPVLAFTEGVLAGAMTPRQVAEKAKAQPKEAADLFARGAVARWYQANGWTYPVQEPSASGLAAVQQFFEALGLTTPPKVGINVAEIRLEGRPGEVVRSTVQLTAQEKKPVYAHASSNQPWLQVNEVQLDGRNATVHLRVTDVPDRGGETLHALLTVSTNGRQKFLVPVYFQVQGRAGSRVRAASSEPIEEVIPVMPYYQLDPPPRRREEVVDVLPIVEKAGRAEGPRLKRVVEEDVDEVLPVRRQWLALAPVLFLALGLMITLGHDLFAWRGKPGAAGPGTEDWSKLPQVLRIHFHDSEEQIRLSSRGGVKPAPGLGPRDTVPGFWEPSMRFGLELDVWDAQGRPKRLTFERRGLTNNAVVMLDGNEWLFGERPFKSADGRSIGSWPGRWLDRNARLDRPLRDGRKSVWSYDAQRVLVTQTVGLVPGAQSGKIDTCLVHYRIDNQDNQPHSVGLRFLLDTFIGANDGVPFLIPGSPQLCDDRLEFRTPREVPDFIQARETNDLANPGTIALIQLRIPGMEPPSRVTLGAWPNPALGPGCKQEKTLWEVPLWSIKSIPQNPDSAVTIYWNPVAVPANGSREVAFAYGLGSVSAGEAGGQLGLSLAGSFVPRGEFTLSAEVRNPVGGQTVSLTLPEGFELVAGELTQQVPQPAGATPVSAVTWKVRAGPREGAFSLQVKSSTGVAQTQKVDIKVGGIFGS